MLFKKFNRKPNKIWVDKVSNFYNRLIKSWLEKNDIEMYSTHNAGTSFAAERFIRTLKNKIYKYMTSISKHVHIDKLDDIVKKYNHTYHRTIKLADVKPNIYIDFNKKNNKEGPKFKVCGNVRISKYKNIFAKYYIPNWSEEVFLITKVQNTLPWTYVISYLHGKDIVGTFYEKELQKRKKLKRV